MSLTLRDLAEERVALDGLLAMDEGECTEEAEALERELVASMVQKADAFGTFVMEQDANVTTITEEITRLTARRKAIAGRVERLERYAHDALVTMGRPKIAGVLYTLSIEKNPPSVAIAAGAVLPSEYLRTVPATTTPDKLAIRDALKRGETVEGCELVTTTKLRIR